MEVEPLPISQTYKSIVIVLMLFRLFFSKDSFFVFLLLIGFQVAPIFGFLKTGDFSIYFQDAIDASRWFTVPLGFFYFKTLFQASYFEKIKIWLKAVVFCALVFLTINLFLGALGYGSAFYFEGYGNEVGTSGFIYAGNELTILILALGFIIGSYLKHKKRHFVFCFIFVLFILFAFLVTSKTVLGGVLVVFAIPWLKSVPTKISKKWLNRIFGFILLGIPLLIYGFYWGILHSGVIKKMETSIRMNEGDLLSTLLSNRDKYLMEGWQVFSEKYSFIHQLFGIGQNYFINSMERSPELDFFTLLFTNGILGLILLLLLIWYWFLNTKTLAWNKNYPFSNQVLLFVIFLVLISNLAGHIFNSAVAGFYIGLAIAMMFYKSKKPLGNSVIFSPH